MVICALEEGEIRCSFAVFNAEVFTKIYSGERKGEFNAVLSLETRYCNQIGTDRINHLRFCICILIRSPIRMFYDVLMVTLLLGGVVECDPVQVPVNYTVSVADETLKVLYATLILARDDYKSKDTFLDDFLFEGNTDLMAINKYRMQVMKALAKVQEIEQQIEERKRVVGEVDT